MNYTLGRLIAIEQTLQNISTKEISERSGYSEDYIRKLMRDEVKSPSIQTYQAIAHALNLPTLTVLIKTGVIQFPSIELLSEEEIDRFIERNTDYLEKANLDYSKLNKVEKAAIASGFLNQLLELSKNKL